MTLIKSISGIRGTIGGKPGENLTPLDIVKFSTAYGQWVGRQKHSNRKIVVGRDARISGKMVQELVMNTLVGMGYEVIDLGLSTTPTVEMAVQMEGASGGIIVTASHNPKQWNALKLLNKEGEFLDAEEGEEIIRLSEDMDVAYAEIEELGSVEAKMNYIDLHIERILDLEWVDVNRVKSAGYKVVVDAVNSTGGIAIPNLLRRLGVEVVELYCDPNGDFPHDPEPLEKNLSAIFNKVVQEGADLGVVVDPDVDRLAFIDEKGQMFGEEYTLVAVADYILGKQKGNTVSNLSSSRALRDVTKKHGGHYYASAVGEVNVVKRMKETGALIGGEGNGGIIFPELHYGRDSLVGVALFLTHLAEKNKKVSELRKEYPSYYMSKRKIELRPEMNVDKLLKKMEDRYRTEEILTIDGVKIDFPENWVHLRRSNTEPIIRIYTEAKSQTAADLLADRFIAELEALVKQ